MYIYVPSKEQIFVPFSHDNILYRSNSCYWTCSQCITLVTRVQEHGEILFLRCDHKKAFDRDFFCVPCVHPCTFFSIFTLLVW